MFLDVLKDIIEDCQILNDKICIKNNNLHEFLEIIKKDYGFNMLRSITAVDLGDETELIYDLFSVEEEESVIVSTKAEHETISVADLFPSAIADENEIYDMFGIQFIGREDLKRLYMPENWNGYPLKKDYVQDDTRLAWNDNSDNA